MANRACRWSFNDKRGFLVSLFHRNARGGVTRDTCPKKALHRSVFHSVRGSVRHVAGQSASQALRRNARRRGAKVLKIWLPNRTGLTRAPRVLSTLSRGSARVRPRAHLAWRSWTPSWPITSSSTPPRSSLKAASPESTSSLLLTHLHSRCSVWTDRRSRSSYER